MYTLTFRNLNVLVTYTNSNNTGVILSRNYHRDIYIEVYISMVITTSKAPLSARANAPFVNVGNLYVSVANTPSGDPITQYPSSAVCISIKLAKVVLDDYLKYISYIIEVD